MNDAQLTASEKIATAAQYVGSGTAAGSGLVFGLTAAEWSIIGVIGGLLFAAAGYFTSTWFKAQHLKLARRVAERGGIPQSSDAAPLGPK